LSFLVRWLHVSSVAFVFGGALLIFILLHFASGNRDASARRVLFDLMRAFEWGSWASLGIVVATGVGNLAQFGEGLSDPRSEWGREFTLKMVLVMAFLLFSAVRTLAVTTVASRPDESLTPKLYRRFGTLYGITAALVGAIVGVAVALAHF
jgi:uncharacterized membrane protein